MKNGIQFLHGQIICVLAKSLFLLFALSAAPLILPAQTNNDTTFILRETSPYYHAIYIEQNKSSVYYDLLTEFNFSHEDSLSYKQSIDYITGKQKTVFTKQKIASSLPRQWCELNSYKENFYLYAPSDRGNNPNLIISDTTIVQYTMDGPYASIISNYRKIDANTFEFLQTNITGGTDTLTIHIIDPEKQLAVFDNHSKNSKYRYRLMVGAAKAWEFPIIVNYCRDARQREFRFDEIDPGKLLPKKK